MTRRLLIAYLTLVLTVVTTLVVPLGLTFQSRVEQELAGGLERDAFMMASLAEETIEHPGDPTNPATPEDVRRLVADYSARTGARVVIVDRDGVALADSTPAGDTDGNFASRVEMAEALAGRVSSGTRYSTTLGTDLFYVAVPVASGQVYGAVRITYAGDQVRSRIRGYWRTLLIITAISLLAATGVAVALARWVSRPIEALRDASTGFGGGDLTRRAPSDRGPPEVRQLAETFNRTADRLEQLVVAQDQFVADASHQLRTPLTALRLRLEHLDRANREQQGLLEEIGADDPDVADDLRAALAETTRLSRLVDELLVLARADHEDAAASVGPVDLAPVIADRAAAWRAMAAERSVTVEAEPSPATTALANVERLSQALDNLIANAVDASPAGATVRLRIEPVPPAADAPGDDAPDGRPTVLIHVTDEGHGMTAEERAHAFDRFWRSGATAPDVPRGSAAVDRSGPSKLGGSGLGLAIVRKLVHADGGDLALDESPTGSVDAVVRLRTP